MPNKRTIILCIVVETWPAVSLLFDNPYNSMTIMSDGNPISLSFFRY